MQNKWYKNSHRF